MVKMDFQKLFEYVISSDVCFADFGGRKHTSVQAAMVTEEHLCPRTCKHPSDHMHRIMALYRHSNSLSHHRGASLTTSSRCKCRQNISDIKSVPVLARQAAN